jgi:hypothetical protein
MMVAIWDTGEKENIFFLLKTEPWFLRCPATSLITLPIMLSNLHQMLDCDLNLNVITGSVKIGKKISHLEQGQTEAMPQ